MTSKGIQTRDVNKKLLIQQLLNSSVTSRAEMARNLLLNKSTISSIYNELDSDGFITDLGLGDSTKMGGRKPHMIAFNKNYGWVACFEIGNDCLSVAYNYLNGELANSCEMPIKTKSVDDLLSMIKHELNIMIDHDHTLHGLLGIGFSVHGIVNQNRILSSPFFDFENRDLQSYFEKIYKVPVILENEANLTAVFERDFGKRKSLSNLVAISSHTGVGAGIIADGKLYRGYKGMSGEIGRQLFPTDYNSNAVDKAENLCSQTAIINAIRKEKRLSKCSLSDIKNFIEKKDDCILRIVKNAMNIFSWIVYNSVQAYGPKEVFLSSEMFEQIPFCYSYLKSLLKKLNINTSVNLIYGSNLASLLGAASLIIHQVLDMDDYKLAFPMPKQIKHFQELT